MNTLHILTLVTVQRSCERLIVEGAQLARDMNGELSVLHVASQGSSLLGYPVEGDALEYLYKISSEHNADLTVIRSDDVLSAITQFVHKKGVEVVVMGASKSQNGRDFGYELMARLPDVAIQTVNFDAD